MFATANMRGEGDSPASLNQTQRIVNLFGYPEYVVSRNEEIHKPSDSGNAARGPSQISLPESWGAACGERGETTQIERNVGSGPPGSWNQGVSSSPA